MRVKLISDKSLSVESSDSGHGDGYRRRMMRVIHLISKHLFLGQRFGEKIAFLKPLMCVWCCLVAGCTPYRTTFKCPIGSGYPCQSMSYVHEQVQKDHIYFPPYFQEPSEKGEQSSEKDERSSEKERRRTSTPEKERRRPTPEKERRCASTRDDE